MIWGLKQIGEMSLQKFRWFNCWLFFCHLTLANRFGIENIERPMGQVINTVLSEGQIKSWVILWPCPLIQNSVGLRYNILRSQTTHTHPIPIQSWGKSNGMSGWNLTARPYGESVGTPEAGTGFQCYQEDRTGMQWKRRMSTFLLASTWN